MLYSDGAARSPRQEFAMPDAVAHPTAQELAAYGQGKLSARAAAAVATHLKQCAPCRLTAGAPTRTTATRLPASEQPALATPLNLPAELASHPRYRVLRELGRGGMGVVYQAEQTVMHRWVAIKVISKSLLDQPDALERFHREVQAAAKLAHPNIVVAHDAEQAGELHMLVMEYVEGQSLDQVLRRRGPLPVPHACNYVRQAALGLQHAFEQGMVHRDIKPGNLMLTPKGRVKILDFGLARLRTEKAQSGRLTQGGAFMGTPEYVAPEQANDARTADIRADIYSLGCTLYSLLAGRPPFTGDTPLQLVLAHLEREPPPLTEARSDLPPDLAAVVMRMLAKEPAARYQTPAEVALALAPFARSGAMPAAAPQTMAGSRRGPLPASGKQVTMPASASLLAEHLQPPATPRSSGRKRSVGLAVGAAIASLALVVILVGILLQLRGPTSDGQSAKGEALKADAQPEPPPAKTPTEKWFTVGTRWEGKSQFTMPNGGDSWGWWFTIRSREGNKFKGRLVGEGRMELAVEGTLADDGTSYRWDDIRHVPNVWQPDPVTVTADGKYTADGVHLDWKRHNPDGQVVDGYCDFTIHRAGPRKDDEEAWPPPLYPRRAGIIGPLGKWSIQDGELVQEEVVEDTGGNAWPGIIFGDLAWKDYDFHFKVMRTAGDHGFIIYFDKLRPTKETEWCLGFPPGSEMYVRVVDALPTGLKFTLLSDRKPMAITDNQWYDILISTRGQWIECFLDGASEFRVPQGDRWGGKVGFFCMRMAMRVKDIEVKAPDGKVLWQGPPELPE
jgi:serine/threonine protein kinase